MPRSSCASGCGITRSEIKELRDGGLELQLQLGSLEEIERWILSWGDQAEVLEPPKLRQRLAEIGQKFVAAYATK